MKIKNKDKGAKYACSKFMMGLQKGMLNPSEQKVSTAVSENLNLIQSQGKQGHREVIENVVMKYE
jgi:hypothetical protein